MIERFRRPANTTSVTRPRPQKGDTLRSIARLGPLGVGGSLAAAAASGASSFDTFGRFALVGTAASILAVGARTLQRQGQVSHAAQDIIDLYVNGGPAEQAEAIAAHAALLETNGGSTGDLTTNDLDRMERVLYPERGPRGNELHNPEVFKDLPPRRESETGPGSFYYPKPE